MKIANQGLGCMRQLVNWWCSPYVVTLNKLVEACVRQAVKCMHHRALGQVNNHTRFYRHRLHYCLCGKHMRVMLVGSAQKAFRRHAAALAGRLARGIENDELSAHASCLWCENCNVPAQELQQVSECAQRCHSLLLGQYKNLFVLQEYNAPKFQGILDLYCPDHKLGIMIDGEQHFSGTRCNEKQVQSDDTFNAGVLEAAGTGEVQGLVRLHHADNQNKYGMMLARGLELSRDQFIQSFVLFSPSFCRQDIIVRTRHDHESGKHI